MKTSPLLIRDFSRGRYSKSAVAESLLPLNSVANSVNVNFDTTIGKAVVRPGTTLLGTVVATGKTPLGLSEFVGPGGSPNLIIASFSGATTSTIYYYDGTWKTSTVTVRSNTAKNRYAVLGGRIYTCNGTDAMISSADGNTWTVDGSIVLVTSLVTRAKGRLLTSGYTTYKDRVYFSSIINQASATPITWNTNPTDGDFIDVNPDDGGYVTGFGETSTITLVFKNNAMYRLNVISKTVDSENIFNIGAVSQEAIVNCQGVTYFFSGQDIRRTNGGLPEQISRLGVQDFIDAIPQSSWTNVCAGTDGFNVFFSIGNVTLNTNQDNERTYNNVVLKFSTRDESWSVHSYGSQFRLFCQYTDSTDGRKMIGLDTGGYAQKIDKGTTDNTTPIYYELQTQEQELGNRSHLKKISDQLVVFSKNGIHSQLQIREGDNNWKNSGVNFDGSRVYICDNVDLEDYYFSFKWFGESTGTSPVLEGFYIEDIEDKGVTNK